MRGWLENRQKEAENNTESTQTYYESVIECLKTEHSEEVHQLQVSYENHEKVLVVMLDPLLYKVVQI